MSEEILDRHIAAARRCAYEDMIEAMRQERERDCAQILKISAVFVFLLLIFVGVMLCANR